MGRALPCKWPSNESHRTQQCQKNSTSSICAACLSKLSQAVAGDRLWWGGSANWHQLQEVLTCDLQEADGQEAHGESETSPEPEHGGTVHGEATVPLSQLHTSLKSIISTIIQTFLVSYFSPEKPNSVKKKRSNSTFGIRSCLEEQLHHRQMAILRGRPERTSPLRVAEVNRGSASQKFLDHLWDEHLLQGYRILVAYDSCIDMVHMYIIHIIIYIYI